MVNTSPDAAANVAEHLNKRLVQKSLVVKLKVVASVCGPGGGDTHKSNHPQTLQVLRLIKFLCAKGPSDFKRTMAKHAGAVR